VTRSRRSSRRQPRLRFGAGAASRSDASRSSHSPSSSRSPADSNSEFAAIDPTLARLLGRAPAMMRELVAAR
jgi:hypothetical protein